MRRSKEEVQSAIEQWAREQVEILNTASAEGQFDKPVLGPLTSAVKAGANWTDGYPDWQKYAMELEELLEFAKRNGALDAYTRELQSSDRRRDPALMELRVGLHLEQSGFALVEWSPKGEGAAKGEFLVEGPDKKHVFVEVKMPSWEAEVCGWDGKARSALQLTRVKGPKYLDGEAQAVGPWQGLRFAVDKAYKKQGKFADDKPNLLVVADDMFVSLAHGTEIWVSRVLYSSMRTDPGCFTHKFYERLGGVGVFWLDEEVSNSSIGYRMRLFLNPNALQATMLPHDMQAILNGEILKG